jgi:lycopene beta-cyclase
MTQSDEKDACPPFCVAVAGAAKSPRGAPAARGGAKGGTPTASPRGVNIVIVGTGVSGLLMAQSLVRRGACERVTLVGPHHRLHPHLLSWWSDFTTPFDAHAVACWSALEVNAGGRAIRSELQRYRYRTLRAQSWADETLAWLLASGRVERVAATVDHIDDDLVQPKVWWNGEAHTADWVFDSAPPPAARADHWQRFEGWELEIPRGAFNTRAATLFDFRTAPEGDFRFVYALPLATDRLFVSHVSYRPCDHARALEAWLRGVARLDSWRVLDREQGATPTFSVPPARTAGRVVRIGVHAGMARTATGYVLTRMWRDAERIAEGLARNGRLPFTWPSSALYRVADAYFGELLDSDPARIEQLLAELFSSTSGDDVLAFLDERASLGAQLSVARAIPEWLEAMMMGLRPVSGASSPSARASF